MGCCITCAMKSSSGEQTSGQEWQKDPNARPAKLRKQEEEEEEEEVEERAEEKTG